MKFDTNSGSGWAGIDDKTGGVGGYTQAYAVTTAPTLKASCNTSQAYMSWVGLGGDGTYQLIQNGMVDGDAVPLGYAGPDGHVGMWTEVLTSPTLFEDAQFWNASSGAGFISRGDVVSMATTFFSFANSNQDYAEYYWHDATSNHAVALKQYIANGLPIIDSYDPTSADYINEALNSQGYQVEPANNQVWYNATSTFDGVVADVGTRTHNDYYSVWGPNKVLGLSPPYLQTNSSWTMHQFACS